jgi:hypothetical protein
LHQPTGRTRATRKTGPVPAAGRQRPPFFP